MNKKECQKYIDTYRKQKAVNSKIVSTEELERLIREDDKQTELLFAMSLHDPVK